MVKPNDDINKPSATSRQPYGSSYKKNWTKWLIIYIILAIIVYYAIYVLIKGRSGYNNSPQSSQRSYSY